MPYRTARRLRLKKPAASTTQAAPPPPDALQAWRREEERFFAAQDALQRPLNPHAAPNPSPAALKGSQRLSAPVSAHPCPFTRSAPAGGSTGHTGAFFAGHRLRSRWRERKTARPSPTAATEEVTWHGLRAQRAAGARYWVPLTGQRVGSVRTLSEL